MIPLVDRHGARAYDAYWIERGVPSLVLMENAGRGAAEVAASRLDGDARVTVLCGTGNNGGDGLVVARHLRRRGQTVRVLMLGEPATPDAIANARAWTATGGALETWTGAPIDAALVIDGLFGTGLSRPLQDDAARMVQAIRAPVLALDVPSGLDADTGAALGVCVRAECTVTFGAAKRGLYTPSGRSYAGEIAVCDIGVPGDGVTASAWLLEPADIQIPARRAIAHKNANGHVLIVGGAPGTIGAPQLAAYGALRAGAGLVSVASWEPAALAHLPMAVMCREIREEWPEHGLQAMVVGPGLGVDARAAGVFAHVTSDACTLPVVLDADVFTWAAGAPERLRRAAKTVLTPHPAELARLLGVDTKTIEADRFAAVARAVERTAAVVVLKGAHTLIAAPGERTRVSPFVEPVLGVAGSGDVLAGVVGALLGNGQDAFEAATTAVWCQGAAAAGVGVDRGLRPDEIADRLPAVMSR